MMTLDKAIRKWGFEDSRTIAIATLEEIGRSDLAVELFKELAESKEEPEYVNIIFFEED